MPNSSNQELLDRAILHAVFLERLKAGEVNEILRILTEARRDLLEQIQRRIENIAARGYDTSVRTSRRLKFLAISLDKILKEGYQLVEDKLLKDLEAIALAEAKFQVKVLAAVTPIQFAYEVPGAPLLQSIATTRPMSGQLLSEYLKNLRITSTSKIMQDIQTGLVLGETIPQISRRVQNSLSLKSKQASTIARTAVNHVTTHARELTWVANSDIVKAVQWVSTLDARTSDICIALDGSIFPVGEGIRPPAHLNCRSTTVPVLRSWKELGIDLKEAPPGTRASMNGQVPEKLNYRDWLKKQSVAIQNKVLGERKGVLFRAGKLKFDQPIYNGRPMTLKELGVIEDI